MFSGGTVYVLAARVLQNLAHFLEKVGKYIQTWKMYGN